MESSALAPQLIESPQPIYPKEALQKEIQGTVRLDVVIARDGSIQELRVLEGNPILIAPAVEAVRRWRYRPTISNNEPLEVSTTIDVVFKLQPALNDKTPGGYPQPVPLATTYPENSGGLKKFLEDVLKAIRENDQKAQHALLGSLIVPKAGEWFPKVFGESTGKRFASDYRGSADGYPDELRELLEEMLRDKMTHLEVRRFDESSDDEADEREYPLLAAREQQVPLYAVHLLRGNYGRTLWPFAYLDGGFRFLGVLKIPESSNPGLPGSSAPEKTLRLGGKFMLFKLHQVPPVYPEEARRRRLEGTVRLLAVVGKDGVVRRLSVLTGRCLLAKAAVDAVSQWKYQPATLEGQPVESSYHNRRDFLSHRPLEFLPSLSR